MNKTLIATGSWLALMAVAASANAAVVTENWGNREFIQHPNTLKTEPAKDGALLVFDLSALPKDADVCRARLVPEGGSGYRLVPVERAGGEVKTIGEQLKLVEPFIRWFDVTEAARKWSKADKREGLILSKKPLNLSGIKMTLEIAYEGAPKDPPQQVTDVKAFYRHGQAYITWKEIEDIAEGNENVTWGQMVNKVRSVALNGMILKDKKRELTYRVYHHNEPITPHNIGKAELVNELLPGTMYADRHIPTAVQGEHGPSYLQKGNVLQPLMLEPNKPLTPGTGFYPHTVTKEGKGFYAVVTCVNGVENTMDISDKNTAGPFDEKVETPDPVLYLDKVTKLGGKGNEEHHEEWYNWWLTPPLSPFPYRLELTVSFCPTKLAKPAPLLFSRSAWNFLSPAPPAPSGATGITISHIESPYLLFFMGCNDGQGNLKGLEDGKWAPHPIMRQTELLKWAKARWEIDPNNITVATGDWGMLEIEDGDTFVSMRGWGLPEVTKGFQSWGRAQQWGNPAIYADRPKEENPWYRQDIATWLYEHPARETPWCAIRMFGGSHFGEMGWPPFPRFLRAMMDTKRPFVLNSLRVQTVMEPKLRLNQSLPAFANCSLDDNIGNGCTQMGKPFSGTLNAYLLWDTETIVDEPRRWEMTVWLDDSAPLPDCTVDLTPRRCQKFKAKTGEKFTWANSELKDKEQKEIQSGSVEADAIGLVTLKQITVTKNKNRIRIGE